MWHVSPYKGRSAMNETFRLWRIYVKFSPHCVIHHSRRYISIVAAPPSETCGHCDDQSPLVTVMTSHHCSLWWSVTTGHWEDQSPLVTGMISHHWSLWWSVTTGHCDDQSPLVTVKLQSLANTLYLRAYWPKGTLLICRHEVQTNTKSGMHMWLRCAKMWRRAIW